MVHSGNTASGYTASYVTLAPGTHTYQAEIAYVAPAIGSLVYTAPVLGYTTRSGGGAQSLGALTPAVTPQSPSVTVRPAPTAMTLVWPSVTGATSYDVYRSPPPGARTIRPGSTPLRSRAPAP